MLFLLFLRWTSLSVLRMKIHWIFRVVSLFNYQGSDEIFDFVFAVCSHKRLCYSNTLYFQCQALFLFFSKSFWSCFKVVGIVSKLFPFETAFVFYHSVCGLSIAFFIFFKIFLLLNGDGGIWTLAPVARPTPLAGAPLRPLEYFSKRCKLPFLSLPKHYINFFCFCQ